MLGMDGESYMATVVAFCDQSRGFGYKGHLPWPYIKRDHQFYMNLCTSTIHPDKKNGILKGRNCWESENDSDRDNPKTSVVVTSTSMKEVPTHCRAVVRSYDDGVEELMDGVRKGELENIWIFGGQRNYQHAIDDPRVTLLYITRIFQEFPVDNFFPEFEHNFYLVRTSEVLTDNSISFQFETWHRKRKDAGTL